MLPFWRCQILSTLLVLSAMHLTLLYSSGMLQSDSAGCDRVNAFESRQLKSAEMNYPVYDKELLAMEYALVKFRVHMLDP